MSDPARLKNLADSYPAHVGCFETSGMLDTVITLNGPILSSCHDHFPLQARLRLYEGSRLIKEYYTREICFDDQLCLSFKSDLGVPPVKSGFFEIVIYSLSESGKSRSFFAEVWCSIFSNDGHVAFNYPALNFKGVDMPLLDAACLYYPGAWVHGDFTNAVVVLNQYDFLSHFVLHLDDSRGEKHMERSFPTQPKSMTLVRLDEVFPGVENFFAAMPGLLSIRFPHKVNAYIQHLHRPSGRVTSMDHLGYIALNDVSPGVKSADVIQLNKRREEDPIVCFCASVPASHIRQMSSSGMNLSAIQSHCGAGTYCTGCLPELEKMLD